jgi:hypothetical protein
MTSAVTAKEPAGAPIIHICVRRERRCHSRLVERGATVLRPPQTGERLGELWVVLADPEGDEFCPQ